MEFSLNTYFEKVFVINMDTDTKRLESVTNELNKINTKFIRTPGIIADKGLRSQEGTFWGKYFNPSSAFGISQAHHKIWKTVVEKNYSSVLCLEDDINFVDNISDIIPKAMKELPDDWDILYLGCITCCDMDNISIYEKIIEYINPTLKNYSTYLNTGGIFFGTEAYAISNKGARKLLEQIGKINWHVDLDITFSTNNLNSFKIKPSVAYQDGNNIESQNTFKIPVILNKLTSNIKINHKCRTTLGNIDWGLSIPLFRFFSDALTFNSWSLLFFLISFIFPILTPALFGYILIDMIYIKFDKLIMYLPIICAVVFGYLLRKILF
jgi:GR25 family glycosyltransferase involved in LPS biosynthesis